MRNAIAIIPLAALLSCGAPVPAFAEGERVSGQQLLEALLSDSQEVRNLGSGYVLGVFDAHSGALHCTPASVPSKTLVLVVLEGLKANAEPDGADLLTSSADNAVMRPLLKAFPCKSANPRGGSAI